MMGLEKIGRQKGMVEGRHRVSTWIFFSQEISLRNQPCSTWSKFKQKGVIKVLKYFPEHYRFK